MPLEILLGKLQVNIGIRRFGSRVRNPTDLKVSQSDKEKKEDTRVRMPNQCEWEKQDMALQCESAR